MSYLARAEAAAEQMGVRVRVAPTPGTLWGVYDHEHALITLRPGLGRRQLNWTIWHELGHAWYGHEIHWHEGCNRKQELAATRWAVMHMFDPDVFESELLPGMTNDALAHALEVMPVAVKELKAVWEERYQYRQPV
ncbi:ImmA/IrrE family metallo-endopeptidase [Galactobacter valiniphilus]|uniref:ImmA/IrrE family metallo-endopeptidase n=1 Tax=Galactobacter valiniphilus TaxID=2676122 RepID=A0A399J672_9MICC|nr:ImmA/IrrE family metallo-endopeptidase [Galactobacter valiniphilus]RII40925.1 ImmA/IrrE family metallo-endopeptidase [Galactobacter valiniphilus]